MRPSSNNIKNPVIKKYEFVIENRKLSSNGVSIQTSN